MPWHVVAPHCVVVGDRSSSLTNSVTCKFTVCGWQFDPGMLAIQSRESGSSTLKIWQFAGQAFARVPKYNSTTFGSLARSLPVPV